MEGNVPLELVGKVSVEGLAIADRLAEKFARDGFRNATVMDRVFYEPAPSGVDRSFGESYTTYAVLKRGIWEKDMSERKFYIVYVVPNGPSGKAAAETVAVIAESSEQAKLIAVHSAGYDPLAHLFFVHQLGVMPDYKDEGK